MSFGQYLIGSVGILVGLGAVLTSASVLRSSLLPGWRGPASWLATSVLAAWIAIALALVLGTLGLLSGWGWLGLAVVTTAAFAAFRDRLPVAGDRSGPPRISASPGLTVLGAAVAAAAFGAFAAGVGIKLGTGMTGFDSTWYHGPFAAWIAESGDTWALHHLAPQFLSWFYPQNSEVVHALGIGAFGTDLVSVFLNLFWFLGCLLAAWCIGRPYGAAPVSMAGVALVIGSTAMADQAGESRNDIVGTFFVLAALAVMLNAGSSGRRLTLGPALVIGLAAGLAAGTKVNFIPAAVVLLGAVILLTEPSRRLRNGFLGFAALVLGGGYWYLRNLLHSGNPLPWVDHIGPLSLPGPDQEVGGRDAGSVWGYLTDPDVIGDWFLPGLGEGFGDGWVLLAALVVAGLVICLRSGPARRAGAAVGLALALAWLVAPTSASGPEGEPNGFVSGLRYLAPALAVGMALLGSGAGPLGSRARWLVLGLITILAPVTIAFGDGWTVKDWLLAFVAAGCFWVVCLAGLGTWRFRARQHRFSRRATRNLLVGAALALVAILVVIGQPVQRYYFENRYESPDFTTPELADAFVWADGQRDEAIGTIITRQYPLWGPDLDNRVRFIGVERPHGGFVEAETCPEFVAAVNGGAFDYLVLALDREGRTLDRPRELSWIETDPNLEPVDTGGSEVVFRLGGPLDPATCRR